MIRIIFIADCIELQNEILSLSIRSRKVKRGRENWVEFILREIDGRLATVFKLRLISIPGVYRIKRRACTSSRERNHLL